MKTFKKLFVVLTVFAMLLVSAFSLAACGETPTPTPHKCGHVCPVEGCGKCLDATCTDPVCANKCPGHTPVVEPHECKHVCPEEDCGKCLDATCTDPVCAEKCPGHTPVVEPHECKHVCPEEGCGKCLDATCTDPVCAEKCPGHTPVVEPHECAHVCPEEDCGKCLDATCEDPVCAEKCPGHEAPSPWWINTDTADLVENGTDHSSVTVTMKSSPVSFSCAVDIAADGDHGYIAVKYSGTATFHEISVYGTKDGGEAKSGVVAAVADAGWNVTKTVGTDFSVVVAQIGGYYGAAELDIDKLTNIGFTITGEADNTFTVLGFELLPNASHNFGTPTPPVVEGELEVSDMKPGWDGNGFTVTKSGDDQVVTFETTRGFEKVVVEVKNYTDKYKYLYIDFTTSADMTVGVWKGSQLSNGHEHFTAGKNHFLIDLTDKSLEAEFNLEFYFDAGLTAGTAYDETRTVTFHEITFSETDPMASTETNSFRTPVGSNLTYTESTKTISYTNTRTDYYRYLEIKLDNHDTDYDVLSLKLTGYNGLVLGVRVLYNDDVDGEITAATFDVMDSAAYYSKIESDAEVELLFYLAAYNLDGLTITGVQLYCDAPAAAGKDGNVEIILSSIEVLKSTELAPENVTLTASNATVAVGETPDFNIALTDAESNAVEGKVITEYLADGSYKAGLPTAAGTYTVRLYYMGSRDYNYSRSVTVTLTITEAAA